MIGKTISHYRIIQKLGRGGVGVVHKAEDTTLLALRPEKVGPMVVLRYEQEEMKKMVGLLQNLRYALRQLRRNPGFTAMAVLTLGLTVNATVFSFVDDFFLRPLPVKDPEQLAVVLTTDCGVEMDDQWALAHLLLSQEFDLRAVITTHASSMGLSSATTAKKAAEVVAHVLPAGASSRPPVMPGSDSPLQNATTPRENAGVDFLLGLSQSFSASRRLIIFITGAGTDVASAILKDPFVVHRVSVVAMGFNDWPAGGDVFNVKNDPLAWQIILDSDVPVVVGSSAVTKRDLRLKRAEAAGLMRPHGPVGEYLYSLFNDWLNTQALIVAQYVAPETWVVWDEVVVAYALGMARSNEVPRPKLRPDLSFSHPTTSRRITWLTEIDAERVWRDFTQKIDARGLRKKLP